MGEIKINTKGKWEAWWRGEKITEQHTAEKATLKLAKYLKGQG